MKAEGLTPLQIFQQAQRLMIPLFQRPYVWGREAQWEPLWDDIVRMAEALRPNLNNPPKPHFLGAIVLQQRNVSIQSVPHRWVIDGQQRLTTLQILIDAVQACMEANGLATPARRLKSLIENERDNCQEEDDVFKLWPTNRDRDAYREVMSASPPIEYSSLNHKNEKIVEAHKYFSIAAQEYMSGSDLAQKISALEIAIKQLLKIVVIDLDADEDAQEIFETLNSRGVKLSAADLIKNYVFQCLEDEGADSGKAYENYWKRLETVFWEQEISSGRLKQPRTAVFLNHFLIARTGQVVTSSEVFSKFKDYSGSCGLSALQLLKEIHDCAAVYEKHVTNAQSANNDLNPVELFIYRTQAMEVEVVKSVLIWLLDPCLVNIPADRIAKALSHIESWIVRRSVVRASAKNFNNFISQIINELSKSDRSNCDQVIESFLTSQTAETNYWPDDSQIREELKHFKMYRLMVRKRTRMILEALEDHARGFRLGENPAAEQRCPRNFLTIEHVMPQKWESHWPLQENENTESRGRAIQTLGNLTLLTTKLNSRVSNGAWFGEDGKKSAIQGQSTLSLNAELTSRFGDSWNVGSIDSRTQFLIERFIEVWPTPDGHCVLSPAMTIVQSSYVSVSDLVSAGVIGIGDTLVPVSHTFSGRYANIASDGSLVLDDNSKFESLSAAARYLRNTQTAAGWNFWRHEDSNKTLYELRDEYRVRFNVVAVDEDEPGEFDEEE